MAPKIPGDLFEMDMINSQAFQSIWNSRIATVLRPVNVYHNKASTYSPDERFLQGDVCPPPNRIKEAYQHL
ncbi:hypothetical protein CEP51_005921 [Fusarium floridanum]|uniref:Uncharacterized protein n=1 Tax=Fusarium floridanum TaxID=1325733 RepID=A0A428RVC9_9HYPO|nr:hypothetical protein CEP51_005921 [Fusarium floridanum]